jgi:hypothetical protein
MLNDVVKAAVYSVTCCEQIGFPLTPLVDLGKDCTLALDNWAVDHLAGHILAATTEEALASKKRDKELEATISGRIFILV